MNVVLVNPPQSGKYAQPPMGLAIIAAVLERSGYPVSVVDANALRLKPEEIPPLTLDADIVGLTAMTPSINTALKIARHIKSERPDLPVILGGPHATLLPEETLATAPEVDIIVRGEGEETIIDLLRALENDRPLAGVPGITCREGGTIISTESRPMLTDLDSLPFLAYHLLPWRKYRPHPPHGRALPFAVSITSRGCPYHCAYCSKPVFGNRFRAQSPERVIDEIIFYREKYGIREIAFYDDVFTLQKDRAYNIADQMIKRDLELYWTCETRVNLVDKELLRHMKRAGCYAIAYGVESAAPEILETISKGITPQQVEEAVAITREVGMQTIGYFMLGSPGETPETIRQTIEFARKLKLDFAQFALATPFPCTELYEVYQREQGKAVPWENFVYGDIGSKENPVFESPQLSRSDLQYWAKKAYRQFYLRPAYIRQRLASIKSPGDIKVNLKGLIMLLGSLKK